MYRSGVEGFRAVRGSMDGANGNHGLHGSHWLAEQIDRLGAALIASTNGAGGCNGSLAGVARHPQAGAAGKDPRIKVVSLEKMAARYAKGELDPQVK
jgi:hypothetical protein